MEILPIHVFENILSYLNSIDRYNAIEALGYDSTMLGTYLNKKIDLALEHRVNGDAFSKIFSFRKNYVTYLDLSGIFWISSSVIMRNCEKLPNLEYLYLLGTGVTNERHTFQKLKKLKCVAVMEPFDVDCALLKRDFNVAHKVAFEKVLNVRFHHVPCTAIPLVSNKWISYVKDGVTAAELANEFEFEYMSVMNSDFADPKSLADLLGSAKEIETLYVRNSSIQRTAVNIEPIKNFTNLTTLFIEVTSVVGLMFLKPILLSCRKLKKLTLDIQTKMFSFVHMKFAPPTLEDLSVTMSSALDFNIEKFFYDTSANSNVRLKRLYLKCHELQLETTVNLVSFMRDNPQLVCVVIICQTTHAKLTDITRLLKSYKNHPHQFFECRNHNNTTNVPPLPLQYYDICETYVHVIGSARDT